MNVRTLLAVGLIALAAWNLLGLAGPSLAADPVEAQMQAAGTLAASLLPTASAPAPQPQPAPQPDASPLPARPRRSEQSALAPLIEPAVLWRPCPGGVCPRERDSDNDDDCPGGVCPRQPQRSADCDCADCACDDCQCGTADGHAEHSAGRRVGPVRRLLQRFRLRHGWRFRGGFCRRCG